jgi:4,5-dihydroxyphthalate decarboxylase
MALELSLSCDNSDLNRALLTGEVEPAGIDLTTEVTYPPRRHRRFVRNQEFDVSELCLASYLSSRKDPDAYSFTAIPVFPSKQFRHAFFYTHADAAIDRPADLNGGRIGVQSWQTAANLWMRGILGEHYGLDLESVTWYRRRQDDVPVDLPDRFDIRPVPGSQGGDAIDEPRDMRAMLARGDLDAVMDPAGSFLERAATTDEFEFVFEDPLQAERDYYRETGIHPPMHVVAVRDAVLEAHPWVAERLVEAFEAARDRALEWNQRPLYHMSIVWAHLYLQEERALMGEDIWEYGLTEKTRKELRTFVRYARDQGLIAREYEPEELFVESTLDR